MCGVLVQYEWPDLITIDKYETIEYWQQRGIVKGTEHGLELQKPCTVEEAVVIATRLIREMYAAFEIGAVVRAGRMGRLFCHYWGGSFRTKDKGTIIDQLWEKEFAVEEIQY